jgi:hypothetical protein
MPTIITGHTLNHRASRDTSPPPSDYDTLLVAEGTRPNARAITAAELKARAHARRIAGAIDAERESCAQMFDGLPSGMSLTPAEVAALIRQRPRP